MKTLVKTSSKTSRVLVAAIALAGLAACGGEPKPAEQPAATPTGGASASVTGGAIGGPFTPDPGGKVVGVDLTTDGAGNYFTPAEVHVKPGDVVRFNLKVGVHNIHFLADSNAGRAGYPQRASDFLQMPGQTMDVLVHLPKGTYYFQCDPHAALGMKGHLVVE
jgi:plastocyanin